MTILTDFWGERMELPNLRAELSFAKENGRYPTTQEASRLGSKVVANPLYSNEQNSLRFMGQNGQVVS